MPTDHQPTTWRTTPVCATDAMIEAGAAAIQREFPAIRPHTAKMMARNAIDAALEASPKPPENDPEVGDRTDG